jgi:ABC-type anion transport system duplicated permease subunit
MMELVYISVAAIIIVVGVVLYVKRRRRKTRIKIYSDVEEIFIAQLLKDKIKEKYGVTEGVERLKSKLQERKREEELLREQRASEDEVKAKQQAVMVLKTSIGMLIMDAIIANPDVDYSEDLDCLDTLE